MQTQLSTAKTTGRRATFLLVLSVFLQSLFAVHAHAETADLGPPDTFENCMVCVFGASADDDDSALPCNAAALPMATAGPLINPFDFERLGASAPLNPAHPPRAPPAADYRR